MYGKQSWGGIKEKALFPDSFGIRKTPVDAWFLILRTSVEAPTKVTPEQRIPFPKYVVMLKSDIPLGAGTIWIILPPIVIVSAILPPKYCPAEP
jgi:hypothetical protein